MKNLRNLFRAVLIIAAATTSTIASFAQAGSLDLSFDTDGKVTTSINNFSEGSAVTMQSDGKILVAGHSNNGNDNDILLVRYNSNGSLDITFDNDGYVTTPIGPGDDFGSAIAVQNDGKIVVTGYSYSGISNEITLVRYNSDGSLDNSFDSDGIVITNMGNSSAYGSSVAIQSDGKIVVAGGVLAADFDFALIRYNSDGSLDNTFDADGIVTTSIMANANDNVVSVVIQNNGKILLAGRTSTVGGSDMDYVLVRYNTDGGLDVTFDADGIVTTSLGNSGDVSEALAIQSDGKIIVGGYSHTGFAYDFALVRYNINGSLDSTFDTDGVVTTPIGNNHDRGNSVAVQSDGKIVLAGFSGFVSDIDFALVRYNSDGSLDVSFDTDGKVTTSIGNTNSWGYATVIQNDGKIVVAGSFEDGAANQIAVVRYNALAVGIKENMAESIELAIYPNPFSISTTLFSSVLLENASLIVYNIFGQAVKQMPKILIGPAQAITLYRDDLPAGFYFVQITQGNQMIFSNKLVITD